MPHLVEDGLDLVEQRLGADELDVVLLEVDALVVERLEVVLLVLLAPHLVEVALRLAPLLVLRLQSDDDVTVTPSLQHDCTAGQRIVIKTFFKARGANNDVTSELTCAVRAARRPPGSCADRR